MFETSVLVWFLQCIPNIILLQQIALTVILLTSKWCCYTIYPPCQLVVCFCMAHKTFCSVLWKHDLLYHNKVLQLTEYWIHHITMSILVLKHKQKSDVGSLHYGENLCTKYNFFMFISNGTPDTHSKEGRNRSVGSGWGEEGRKEQNGWVKRTWGREWKRDTRKQAEREQVPLRGGVIDINDLFVWGGCEYLCLSLLTSYHGCCVCLVAEVSSNKQSTELLNIGINVCYLGNQSVK